MDADVPQRAPMGRVVRRGRPRPDRRDIGGEVEPSQNGTPAVLPDG
jgi:hypothetical protein